MERPYVRAWLSLERGRGTIWWHAIVSGVEYCSRQRVAGLTNSRAQALEERPRLIAVSQSEDVLHKEGFGPEHLDKPEILVQQARARVLPFTLVFKMEPAL